MTECRHSLYPCERVLIDPYPVWDRRQPPRRVLPGVRCACLCRCAPCTSLRLVRHAAMGVPGLAPGFVRADKAAVSNRALLGTAAVPVTWAGSEDETEAA